MRRIRNGVLVTIPLTSAEKRYGSRDASRGVGVSDD